MPQQNKPAPVSLTATAHSITASAEARTIEGVITILDAVSDDSRMIFQAGSLTPRDPIKRVKLLVDHDMAQPVGYMTEFSQPAGNSMRAKFYVPEGDAGDKALADAATGRRDGFSVGVSLYDFGWNDDGVIVVKSGQIHEVSLCAVPAFQDAQVEKVAATLAARTQGVKSMTEEEKAAAEAAAAAAVTAAAETAAAAAAAEAPPVGPVLTASGERQGPAPRLEISDRPLSLKMVAAKVSGAVATGDPAALMAALADVVPANDAGKGWLRDGWMGELWTASRTDRPWIDAFGPVQPLTSMKLKGWKWGTRPKPAKYAGNKAEVPTNSPTTVPAEFNAGRWAGGWDIDRIFLDLGEAGFLESFWAAAMAEYKRDSNTDIAAQVQAAATDKGAASSALGAIKAIARDLRNIGATASTIFLGNDVFDEYADLTQAEVPHWLANVVGGVDIANDTATVGPLTIKADPDMPADEALGLDKRAGAVHEKTPIKVQAYDIAKGGVDLGFYSYGALAVSDPRSVVKYTVTPGV